MLKISKFKDAAISVDSGGPPKKCKISREIVGKMVLQWRLFVEVCFLRSDFQKFQIYLVRPWSNLNLFSAICIKARSSLLLFFLCESIVCDFPHIVNHTVE
jgi:hypothetical protein